MDHPVKRKPTTVALLTGALVAVLALVSFDSAAGARGGPTRSVAESARTSPISAYVPPVRHVFVINIENKGYETTWGAGSAAPYLARTLRSKGVLLNTYYGTAHNSQPNYVAQISGQGPNPQMQSDCQIFSNFAKVGTASPGQQRGSGCVLPAGTPNLATQLSAHGLRWKGYMQDMTQPCQHPTINTRDTTQSATATKMYAARHDPFVYFHSIIDRKAYCARHVRPLSAMVRDLRHVRTTPNLSYITPDLCADGHDAPCADGRPGGLTSVNAFMKRFVPKILASPAFRKNGVLIITADESDGPQSDATACCGEGASANSPLPGIVGDGGGLIGALVISRWTRGNTWSTTPYHHSSLLASMEEIFRLPRIGYAGVASLNRFGLDIYNSGWH
jgi:hypothetical protein